MQSWFISYTTQKVHAHHILEKSHINFQQKKLFRSFLACVYKTHMKTLHFAVDLVIMAFFYLREIGKKKEAAFGVVFDTQEFCQYCRHSPKHFAVYSL